jgi:D-lactate dehydrogenase
MKPYERFFTDTSPAMLVDVSAENPEELAKEVAIATAILAEEGATDIDFADGDAERAHLLWDMRKGFIPMFGATRPKGTTMLTEDVAAPVDRLADFVIDMRALLDEYGYPDGVLFGHALAGNLHFQIAADFGNPAEVDRFDRFSVALGELVSVTYGGSLKAEHGTGQRSAQTLPAAQVARPAYSNVSSICASFAGSSPVALSRAFSRVTTMRWRGLSVM